MHVPVADQPANTSTCMTVDLAKGEPMPSGWSSNSSLEKPAIACYFAVFWMGWVTMLILVIPACLTASMTEANAPKGTRSSARR